MVGTKLSRRVMVIGGGAAGFFAAINLAMREPSAKILIVEKTGKLLSKVKVSGGGRCNVTHHCFDARELVKNYPRGHRELLQVFSRFSVTDTVDWFLKQGIRLKTEEDGRMFPVTDSSQTIIDCFLRLAAQLKIDIETHCEVQQILKKESGFVIRTSKGEKQADAIICSSGGHNKAEAYDYLSSLGHSIVPPLPSLFTINLPGEKIKTELRGIAVPNAEVRIENSKLKYNGPVLITHWGLSGPAVLKLSAFAAEEFFKADYKAGIRVNWIWPKSAEEAEQDLKILQKEKARAFPSSLPAFQLPRRLWEFFCGEAGMNRTWAETGNPSLRKLCSLLCDSRYQMQGKTTFKEEFVTCGGVNLKEVDFKTMQSKVMPGLFFCGEVLNIDGITGGFNFQSAWSTAWLAAQSV